MMCYLVITLTFSTPLALATIYKSEIHGQDRVPGIVRSNDNVVIVSESTMPCSVSASFLNQTNQTFYQMSCGTGLPMSCTYNKQLTNITGRITATVKESGSGLTQESEAYVDNIPPEIMSVNPQSLGNLARVNYNIRDQANNQFPGKCSGISKVELLINNKVVNSTNHTMGICEVTGSVRSEEHTS